MNAIKSMIILIGFTLLAACSKWIDVKPSDRLSDELLFSDRDGFLKALNGIYVEMANDASYGKEMSAGMVDVLGQYYYITSTEHTYYDYTAFIYTSTESKTMFDNVWKKAYELIANCNVILEECGDKPSTVLPDPYYGMVKGEALALRAFFHLDMLRLFGPIYRTGKTTISIPYVTKSGFDISPLLAADEVMQHITDDLQASLQLLENTDPIRSDGVSNSSDAFGSNALSYRQYRLNYYAVKALLARAYLWKDDQPSALATAKDLLAEVQQPGKEVFPYVKFADATNAQTPDRMFSSEVMFAVYDINRVKMFDALFSAALQTNSKLSFTKDDINDARVNELYDDANDYRRRIWQNVSAGTTTTLSNLKYQDIADSKTPGRYMIPLIRLSEVLLIAAECSPELEEGAAYLNLVRTSRNCFDLVPTDMAALKSFITKEFRKEVIGEGQQFFYYKRNALQIVPNSGALVGTKTMVLNNYVVPLPESEISQRNDY